MKIILPYSGYIVKIMRWTLLISCIICSAALAVTASSASAQQALEKKISISLKNVPLKEALDQLAVKAGTSFMYSGNIAASTVSLTINAKNRQLKRILDEMLAPYPYSYTVADNEILIRYDVEKLKPKEAPADQAAFSVILPIEISGKVLDEDGQPLVGATVRVKGTTSVTLTDANGEFRFANAEEQGILIVTYIGFQTKEVAISARRVIISLERTTSQLDQVQIIGYGATTKRLNVGNVSTIKALTLEEQPVSNPLLALKGRVAGLQITEQGGLPGGGVTVQIRGRNSIAAINNPLYIVDGIPFSSTAGRFTPSVESSPLNTIIPSDIESIEILKDADATAIYGSRAANGVILITTKKGEAGNSKFDLSLNTTIGTPSRVAQTLNTQQYIQVRQDAFKNSGLTPTLANAPDLLGNWDQSKSRDWQDWFMGNTANINELSATLSGGNQQTTFMLSGNYRDETTIQPGDSRYNRVNIHLSLGHTSLDQKMRIQANTFYTKDKNNYRFYDSATLLGVARTIPFYPVYNSNGGYNWEPSRPNFQALYEAYSKVGTDDLNGSFQLEYKILKGLDIKSNIGLNRINSGQLFATPATAKDPALQSLGSSAFGDQTITTYLFEPQISYKTEGNKGSFELLGGATFQQNLTQGKSINVSGYINDLLLESPGFGTSTTSGNTVLYKYISVFGRLIYNWQNKYIANLSLRRDGSTKFGPGRKFGNFGSIGAGWLFSNEDFINSNLPWLSYGKIRGSYGTTGNDGIGDYKYLSIYSSIGNYGATPAISTSQIANTDFRWEENKKFEIALELGLIQDKILFTSSWYQNRSGNQLVGYPLPGISGFSSYQANLPAVVENTGLELELNTKNFQQNRFKWTTSINLTIPRNRLVSFPNLSSSTYAGTLIIGQSLNVIQKLRFLGVDPQTGIPAVEDVNKDGAYTLASSYNDQGGDYVNAGTTDPKWYGGVSNSLSYRNFKLDVFFQYTKQKGINLFTYSGLFGRTYNFWTTYLGYWKQPGDVTSIPKPFAGTNNDQNRYSVSDAIISDASFLRLQNVSLSYNLPQSLCDRLKMKNLRIYLQGQNLWTITKFNGYDPEGAIANNGFKVPILRMIRTGIQCSL